jgi:hypothetical protein
MRPVDQATDEVATEATAGDSAPATSATEAGASEIEFETRAARRARLRGESPRLAAAPTDEAQPVEEAPLTHRLVRMLAVAAVAGLAVLAAHAHPVLLAALLAWCSAGIAWGWPVITGLLTAWRAALVIVVGGVASSAAVGFVDTAPHLRLVPVALAVAIVLMFLLQLTREDKREGLTDEVVATAGALAFVGTGACLVPLARVQSGPPVLTIAMAGVVASLAAELLGRRGPVRAWLVPAAMLLGGLAGLGVALALGGLTWGTGLLLGMFSGALSYAVRRLIEVQPGGDRLAAQIASACASVLSVGALAYLALVVAA